MTEEEKKKLEEPQKVAAVAPEEGVVETPAEVTPQPSESQRYIDKILSQWEERKKANEKADRRDRVREAIGGIGDVASALAKLHYTTEYAPYVGGENLSEKARQRAAQAKANRDKNLDQWMHYVLNVAGKKEQARQAAERDKLTKDHYERQAKIAADNAAKKQTEDDAKDFAASYAAAMLTGVPADVEAQAIAVLDKQRAAGQLGDNDYEARKKALGRERSSAELTLAKNQTSQDNAVQRSTRIANAKDSGRGGSRSNTHQYVGFADGSGVWINKNDVSDITSLYDRKDFPKAYKAKDGYGNVKTNLSREDKLNAVIHYLSLNRNNSYENWLRQVEKRPRTAKPQQPKPKGNGSLLPNQNGKTTGSLLPKK